MIERAKRRTGMGATYARTGLLTRASTGGEMKASSGIEMMVRLERGSGESLRSQLERRLRESVRSGALRDGAPLPSSRALAAELGIARGVVTEAYAQLAAE